MTTNLQDQLQAVVKENNIRSFVAEEALGNEDTETFFRDLAQYGCQSGMV
ncbi:MAG: hypothetical protein ACNI26_08345 [Terasakiella sp.]